MLGKSSADQTEYFSAGATLGKNNTKQNKKNPNNNNKHQKEKKNSETLNPPARKKLIYAMLH
jgi:hypothetical protein